MSSRRRRQKVHNAFITVQSLNCFAHSCGFACAARSDKNGVRLDTVRPQQHFQLILKLIAWNCCFRIALSPINKSAFTEHFRHSGDNASFTFGVQNVPSTSDQTYNYAEP
jgi:hypothetical protein